MILVKLNIPHLEDTFITQKLGSIEVINYELYQTLISELYRKPQLGNFYTNYPSSRPIEL